VSIDTSAIAVQEELSGAGSYINGAATTISGQLSSLVSLLAPLQDYWTGVAATQWSSYQMEWNTAANGLFGPDGVLGEIAAAMNVSWGNYADAEFANVSTWQSS
jgi:WXG100 family type VII secretion target